jgi:sporulation protein YlmC with PRC-barrel domain
MALAITRRKWRTGPTFDERQIASLNSPARVAQIYDHYGVSRTQTSASTLTPAGRRAWQFAGAFAIGPVMQLASDVIGKDVINRQDEDIGQVDDLLVDWSGQKPTFAVISADRLLKKDLRFAVPLRSLLPGQRDKVVIDANRSMFEQALPLTEKAWNSAGDQTAVVMYRYEDGDPDNTKRNALDRHTQALTPFNQSEAKSDRHTTQTIRRAVSRERAYR